MATVKKYRFWILLTIFYIVTRSAFLRRYPIFNDEAIYIQILAARLVSVIAGYGTLMAVVWLGRWLHTPKAGFTAGVLYTLSPLMFPQYRMYAAEAWQYVDGWPSGYGVMEAIDYVDKHRSGLPALIGLRWDSGNPEDTVLFYAPRYPSLAAEYLDVGLERTKQVLAAWQGRPIYFITRKGQLGGWDPGLRLLATLPKPSGQEQVEVYAFAPKFQ